MITVQKTKWNKNQNHLKALLKDDFGLTLDCSTSPNFTEDLIEALMDIYNAKCAASGLTLRTNNLTQMGKQACEIFNFTKEQYRDIRTHLKRVAAQINEDNDLDIKSAPVISISEMMSLAKELWNSTNPMQRGSKYKRRAAATAIALATYSGLRWVDVTRLKWEDLQIQRNRENSPIFLRIRLRRNKTTMDNERRLTVTIAATANVSLCPLKYLKKWWHFTGRQLRGYVFPVNTSTHMLGDQLIYQARKMALRLNWSVLPGKHTCRVSLVVHLFDKGFTIDEICRHFHWAPNSAMPFRYLSDRLEQREGAIAQALADEANTENPFQMPQVLPVQSFLDLI